MAVARQARGEAFSGSSRLEPSQVVVGISGRDASVAPQEILQPAVSVVDRRICCDLNVKGTSHPLPS